MCRVKSSNDTSCQLPPGLVFLAERPHASDRCYYTTMIIHGHDHVCVYILLSLQGPCTAVKSVAGFSPAILHMLADWVQRLNIVLYCLAIPRATVAATRREGPSVSQVSHSHVRGAQTLVCIPWRYRPSLRRGTSPLSECPAQQLCTCHICSSHALTSVTLRKPEPCC